MADQELVTDDEARWYQRLRDFEQIIFENRANELSSRFNQLACIWEVVTNGYYRDYNARDDDSEGTLADWFGYLRAEGGVPISYSSWREIYKTVVAGLSCGKTLETCLKAACVAPRLATTLEDNNVLKITSPEGNRQVDATDGVQIEYSATAGKVLSGGSYGDYLERIAEMPSSRHAAETIRHDVGRASIAVTAMWTDTVVSDVVWRDYYGEVALVDEQGETPYQFRLSVESEMPTSAQRMLIAKLSQRFKFLAGQRPAAKAAGL